MVRNQFDAGFHPVQSAGETIGVALIRAASVASIGLMVLSALPVRAQTPIDCPAPARGEYLLLAPTNSLESQALVRSKAPSDATIAICRYFGETVTRIGGFSTESAASVWGQYLIRTTGVKVTIATPLAAPVTPATTPPIAQTPVTPTAATPTPVTPAPAVPRSTPSPYGPKILGTGYAVIVNYNNRPEAAAQLRQAVNAKVGVVSYDERPYLLANQTSDKAAANAIMQLLSDRGFFAMVVDARRVVLLKTQTP